MAERKPVLWHIPVSHYNEKVRWALELKGVEHERRAPPPPANMAVSAVLTRGRSATFPLLQLEGRALGDSTEIIAALEERYPEPPLYPADPGERRRALELEDYFDEELAPAIRLLAWHEVTADRDGDGMGAVVDASLPPQLRGIAPVRSAAGAIGTLFVRARYGVSSKERAQEARERIHAALDRLETELGEEEYLVGGTFTVADLTAASILYPLARPPEAPQVLADPPPALEAFIAPLRERRGIRYVAEMFRRHRKPAAAGALSRA